MEQKDTNQNELQTIRTQAIEDLASLTHNMGVQGPESAQPTVDTDPRQVGDSTSTGQTIPNGNPNPQA